MSLMMIIFSPRAFLHVYSKFTTFRTEPGSPAQIKKFTTKYGVEFPIMTKIDVNGANAHPLFVWMKGEIGPEDIKWNFGKFLIDKGGGVAGRYAPDDDPLSIEPEIAKLL